jgi:predicted ATP-dependent endonuclease of OLD family
MPEYEQLCDFQVKMFLQKIKKYSIQLVPSESEKDNMFRPRRYVNLNQQNLDTAAYPQRSLTRHAQKVLSFAQQITKNDPAKVLRLVSKLYSKVVTSESKQSNTTNNKNSITQRKNSAELLELVKHSLSSLKKKSPNRSQGQISFRFRAAYIQVAAAISSEIPPLEQK